MHHFCSLFCSIPFRSCIGVKLYFLVLSKFILKVLIVFTKLGRLGHKFIILRYATG